MMRRLAVALAALAMLAGCSSRPDYVPRYFSPIGEGELVLIPLDPPDRDIQLVARICRPDDAARAPVVVIAHGAPSDPARIGEMQPTGCDSEPARWFNDRGYIVVFALRRGFGGSTGPMVESTVRCDRPSYFRPALAAARDIDATVKYATALPYAQPTGAIVIGQSTGGWATIAYDSVPHPQVAALISMAGGTGGHAYGEPGQICDPEAFLAATKRFGQISISPMLWVYAQNDSFFPPDWVRQMASIYQRTGSKLIVAQVPPYGQDGHGLFYAPGGSQVWGPIIQNYLAVLPSLERRRPGYPPS